MQHSLKKVYFILYKHIVKCKKIFLHLGKYIYEYILDQSIQVWYKSIQTEYCNFLFWFIKIKRSHYLDIIICPFL